MTGEQLKRPSIVEAVLKKGKVDALDPHIDDLQHITDVYLNAFPEPLRLYINEVVEKGRQHPEHFIFPIMAAFSYASCRSFHLKTPEYTTYPNLYFMTVGRKGSGKTNGHKVGLKPIREIEKVFFDEYEKQCDTYTEEKGKRPIRKTAVLSASTSIEQIEQATIESKHILFDLDEYHGMLSRIQDKNGGDRYSSFFNKNYSDPWLVVSYKNSKGGLSEEATNTQMCSTQPPFFLKMLSGEFYYSGLSDKYLFMPLLRDKKQAKPNSGYLLNHSEYKDKVLAVYNHGEPSELEFTNDAYYCHIECTNLLSEQQKVYKPDSILHGYFDKLDIALSKLSIILHLMHQSYTGGRLDNKIEKHIVERAYNICLAAFEGFKLCLETYQNSSNATAELTKGDIVSEVFRLWPKTTEYALAQALGCSKQNINQLRKS